MASNLLRLHILTHYNAIANNGIAVQPRLVSHTSKLGKTIKTFPTIELGKLMSQSNSSKSYFDDEACCE